MLTLSVPISMVAARREGGLTMKWVLSETALLVRDAFAFLIILGTAALVGFTAAVVLAPTSTCFAW